MKKVIIPLAPGFEEIEIITVVDILRRSGAKVIIAGVCNGPIKGSRGIKIFPDESIDEIKIDGFDLVVLPGGKSGVKNLIANRQIFVILKKMNSNDKFKPLRRQISKILIPACTVQFYCFILGLLQVA